MATHAAQPQLPNTDGNSQASSECPIIANCPWAAQKPGSAPAQPCRLPKFWEKPVACSRVPPAVGPVLCSLKFTSPHWWSPPPARPQKRAGGTAAGLTENPDGAKKMCGRAPCHGPLIVYDPQVSGPDGVRREVPHPLLKD